MEDQLQSILNVIEDPEQRKKLKLQILQSLPLDLLPPKVRSVLTGAMIGGIQGMMDAAAIIGLEKLPSELRGIVKDLIKDIDWKSVPGTIVDVFDSFFNETGPGLISKMGDMIKGIDLTNIDIGGVFDKVFSGDFGDVTKFLSDLGSIPFLSNLLPGTGILNSVSTILGLFDGGIGNLFNNLFSNGGFGLTSVLNIFGVSSTLTGLIGPLLGLFGFGGGANSKCPCDPSCRKTDHFVTEDGVKLLEKCSSVIPNSSSTYLPKGGADIKANNSNVFSDALGLVTTGIGESLIPPNIFNLTEFITGVPRIGKMAQRVESSRNADFPDWQNELIYTFKAIETGMKVNDNNVTKIEEIVSLFARADLFKQFFSKAKDDFVFEVLHDLSMSIRDLQIQTTTLDRVKRGGWARAFPTPAIAKTKAHIGTIPVARSSTRLDWLKVLDILQAVLDILNLLKPGNNPEDSQVLKSQLDNSQNNNEDDPYVKWQNEVLREEEQSFYNFPEIGTPFLEEDFIKEQSEYSPETIQEKYYYYSGQIPPEAVNQTGDRNIRNNILDSIDWNNIVTNAFTAPGRLEQIGGSAQYDEDGNVSYSFPEFDQNSYIEPLKKIFEYYEQEANSGKETYC